MNSYPSMNLETAGVAVLDCEHKTPSPASEGKPYVAIPDVREGKLDLANARLISLSDYETWTKRTKPQADDVILTRRARVGDTAVIPQGLECALGQNLVILRSDGRIVDQRFLRWLVRGPEYWDQVYKYQNEGAVFSSLNVRDISKFQLSIPPLASQRRIAEILGRLDDKIEVNRRINRTLEAMAQALYRHWFVDFGPFQDGEFVESEVGLVPRGWEAVRLGDVIEVFDRLRVPLSSMERAKRPGPYRYFGATGVVDYIDDYIFDGTYVLTGEDGSVITDRDTPVVQYVFGQFWVNNHAHVLRGRNGVSTEHVKVFLDQTNVRSFVTGAVQPKISQANLRSIPYLSAPPEVNARFDAYLQPWFAKIRAIEVENEKLAATRDYLLPRLLAGEVEVSYAT